VSELDTIREILEKLSRKKYKCTVVEECIQKFVEDLDRELKEKTDCCFVEAYNDEVVAIAYGLLGTVYVELDYDVVEIVKVKPRILKR